ncbi:M14 family zinc carboxypeptidase [Marinicella sp. S1101]|uniref:M14 family zinc carboxypeptidase n=1 Tax=Marinicella marina TaxID=2996016 RepID=UPI002260E648|nr:M14 family zinc carboxypeptidase [Marinicella marina]MCX7553347.1 M14 family zinc carboxypeptidase [Marinicella marina]MDJ1139079.1 M14 family zinc carboxypeptidase [Marinicella marina]
MIKKSLTLISLLILAPLLVAKPLEFYLPEGEMYDASVPSPEAILGQQLGDKHLRHDQLISYLSVLSTSRPNAQLIDYGRSNEGRRLVMLAISSAANIENIEQVKADPDVLKILNGFSVHGNESSGSNASVLFAWYLLATNNPEVKAAMENTVVLIDPSFNPDGLSRFTTYVNNNRSLTTVTDANDMSHVEQWPSGRTNHYWFDLNRDWLLLTQTESKARIKQFHQWQPHILTDHHEMGSAATFFFQPGVPSRKNPLISAKNVELTNELAKFHGKALDAVGQRYYNEESFDDFYPGKGSTYPDLQGSVGILFEQARAMGGVIDTRNGQTTLANGIRNQFLTARSTLAGAQANRQAFIDYKKNFFTQAKQNAKKLSYSGYLVDVGANPLTAKKLRDYLQQHRIEFENLAADKTVDGHKYSKNQALYIPLNQDQTTLVQSLFNTDTTFENNTFYDVSAWNLGMAWGLNWTKVSSRPSSNNEIPSYRPQNSYNKNAKAYVFDWHSGNAPAALQYLTQQNKEIFITGKSLDINGVKVPAGSFILPIANNANEDELFSLLSTITDAFSVKWYALSTSMADKGVDLGSPAVQKLKTPKVMMLVGMGIDAYQAGSLWHLFDTQVYLPLTKVRLSNLSRVDLNQYTHIIMPSGNYKSAFDERMTKKIDTWVKKGGHLVAIQSAATWVENNLQKTATDESKKASGDEQEKATAKRKAYGDFEADRAQKVLGGAIISADADLTHPLAFGTHLNTQHVLMKGSSVLSKPDAKNDQEIYNIPLQVSAEIKAAGFVSDYWLEKLQEAPLVVAERSGNGSLIKFGFNPNFRAFWYGTQRWMINSVFMADLIRKTAR